MSETAATQNTASKSLFEAAGPRDYYDLLKPRVMTLVIFTAFVGMILGAAGGAGGFNPILGLISLLAIAVGAGASGALNMWWDADIDAVMARTVGRPIPRGSVPRAEAAGFGGFLSLFAVVLLALSSNYLAAGLLAFTIFFYVVVYSMWLKRATPQNIVIGGAAGALPPVVGWAAASGTAPVEAWVLFAIIFLWTPPHFWALALYREGDYERAGIPMMPNVHGPEATRRQIFGYSLVLAVAGLAPALIGFASIFYAGVASLMGAVFVLRAYRVLRSAPDDHRPAKQLFGFSIFYLFAIFGALLVEGVVAYVR